MSGRKVHQYFGRRPSKWSILGFLDECDEEPFQVKGNRADRQLAREWENNRKNTTSSVRLYRPRFHGSSFHEIGTINGGTELLRKSEVKSERVHIAKTQKQDVTNLHSPSQGNVHKDHDISLGQKRPHGTLHGDENDESDSDESPCESAKKRSARGPYKTQLKRMPVELQTSISESDTESGSEYNQSLSDTERKGLPTLQLKNFRESFEKMHQSGKWLLSSGSYVEDIIFNHGQKLSTESLMHSWIIDLNDAETTNLFTSAEQGEIRATIRKVPEVSRGYAQSLIRFAQARTADELRHIMETTSFRPEDEAYDREKHFDAEWAENVVRNFLMDVGDPAQRLQKAHLEGWFDANVWASIIDRAFGNLHDIELVRKESASVSTSARKNRARSRSERKKMGRRIDVIFRSPVNNLEFGAIEVGKMFDGTAGTKRLNDYHKLAKVMHDMLVSLGRYVKNEEVKVKKLQVVGLLHSGRSCDATVATE
ncbi:hypothetical protein BC938DRAFT_471959 [Jimgerdemannia flammicorona]|uniref:Uncharacterized protein n=1 Tax=Jimgerdemannia flammicorona TaxID=994334 RepID=A0A433QUA6_9FUNG|nr:hypothetical protein BC938DRAFT_471959 [Jimgerdemannia flammicorona]